MLAIINVTSIIIIIIITTYVKCVGHNLSLSQVAMFVTSAT